MAHVNIDAYRERARDWLRANAPAFVRTSQIDVAGELAKARAWQALKAAHGYAAITLPEQYGGAGGTELEKIVFTEEELAYDLPTSFYGVSLGMPVPIFLRHAPEAAKMALAPSAIRGEQIWCQLFSEPMAGSDLAALRLQAKRQGDGWVLNGQKLWTTWAQFADWGVIVVRTDPSVPKHAGLTYFYLNMHSPGIEVRTVRKLGGEQDVNEVFFTDVFVPDEQRLGAVGEGFRVALETLMIERYAIADEGGGGPSLESFISLAKQARIGGRSAFEDGEVRKVIADAFVERQGLRSVHLRALQAIARGVEPGPEGAIRKLLVAKTRYKLASMALELMGPDGVELDVELSVRADFAQSWLDAPALRIAGGTDEILRNTIAEKILRLPQDYRPDKGVPFNQL